MGAQAKQIQTNQFHQNNMESIIEKTVKSIIRKKLNIVASGFHDSGWGRNDTAAFINLCANYLGIVLSVVRSTRLKGHVVSQDTGNQTAIISRPHWLLVISSSQSLVDDILSKARLLRGADDEVVRRNVFLSRDLMKEEAKTTFEKREARRLKLSSRNGAVPTVLSASSLPFVPSLTLPTKPSSTHTVVGIPWFSLPCSSTASTVDGRPDGVPSTDNNCEFAR